MTIFKSFFEIKKGCDVTNIDLNVDNRTTKSILFVEFLGINLDDKWNFDLHFLD